MSHDVAAGASGGAGGTEPVPWILQRATERHREALSGDGRADPEIKAPRPVILRPTLPPAPLEESHPAPTFPDAASGLDDRARRALRAAQRRAWVWVGGGLALFIVFVVLVSIVEGRAETLERTGARVPGAVTKVNGQGEGASVVIEFSWQERLRREVVHLGGGSPAYDEGQTVAVVVDRSDPEHVSLPGETNSSPVTTMVLVAALVLSVTTLIVGVVGLARVGRHRRHLRHNPWRRVRCRARDTGLGEPGRILMRLDEDDGRAPIVGLPRLQRRGHPEFSVATKVEVAGDAHHYVVLRLPDKNLLSSARPPATAGRAKRWRRSI